MKNKKTVLVSGAFDVLHPGHLDFFKQAKALGDKLIVIIGRDDTIKELKGSKPWDSQEERRSKIEAISEVDEARVGYPGSKYKIIKELKPDIIALGYDQMSEDELKEQLNEMGVDSEIVRLKPFYPEKYKSTIIKRSLGGQKP